MLNYKLSNFLPQLLFIIYCCCDFFDCVFVLLAGIPAAPGRPVAQEASMTAVMVHWPPPATSAHSVVSNYTVEYRQEGVCVWGTSWIRKQNKRIMKLEAQTSSLSSSSDSLLWQQVASSREECVQIDALIPGGHYQFRVRASNRWGLGSPSEPSNMVTLPSSSKSVHTNTL